VRRRTPQPPLATLRANWTPPGPRSQRVSGPVAQACEYGQVMGPEALRRQWMGGQGRNWKQVCELLGWAARHLRSVA
jgi:hypothetical protein